MFLRLDAQNAVRVLPFSGVTTRIDAESAKTRPKKLYVHAITAKTTWFRACRFESSNIDNVLVAIIASPLNGKPPVIGFSV